MRNVFLKTVDDDRVSVAGGSFDNTGIRDGWADIIIIAQVHSKRNVEVTSKLTILSPVGFSLVPELRQCFSRIRSHSQTPRRRCVYLESRGQVRSHRFPYNASGPLCAAEIEQDGSLNFVTALKHMSKALLNFVLVSIVRPGIHRPTKQISCLRRRQNGLTTYPVHWRLPPIVHTARVTLQSCRRMKRLL